MDYEEMERLWESVGGNKVEFVQEIQRIEKRKTIRTMLNCIAVLLAGFLVAHLVREWVTNGQL